MSDTQLNDLTENKSIIENQTNKSNSIEQQPDQKQEEDENNQLTESQTLLENSLKDLLEKILGYLEKYIKTKEDLTQVENKLNDYENLNALVDIIKNIFSHLTGKIDSAMENLEIRKKKDSVIGSNESSFIYNQEEYEILEKQIIKHEAEIRNHIGIEQQLKLYADSLQSQLSDSEKTRTSLLDQTKHIMNQQFQSSQQSNSKQAQQKQASKSVHLLQKQSSYKKMQNEYIQQLSKRKARPETPPQFKTSPGADKRIPTPNTVSTAKTGPNKTKDSFRNSYQRFYNQVKHAREDSLRPTQKNKDIKAIYSKSAYQKNPTHSLSMHVNQNSDSHKQLRSISRDKELKTLNTQQSSQNLLQQQSQQQIIQQKISQSMMKNNNATHKRSKSHQVKQVRGMYGYQNNNNNINNQLKTDFSRSSNQINNDFSDLQLAGSMIEQHNRLK